MKKYKKLVFKNPSSGTIAVLGAHAATLVQLKRRSSQDNVIRYKPNIREELCCLLNVYSESLAMAYQKIHECDFWQIAMEARLACEALQFEIDSQKKEYLTH